MALLLTDPRCILRSGRQVMTDTSHAWPRNGRKHRSALVGLVMLRNLKKYDSSRTFQRMIVLPLPLISSHTITMSRPSAALLRPLIASSSRTTTRSAVIARHALPVLASRGIKTSAPRAAMILGNSPFRRSTTPRQLQQRKPDSPRRF
jgi:hypothetical protein